jgi:AmmeMemoRadiSam system protein B
MQDIDTVYTLGEAIVDSIAESATGQQTMIVASSDLTHYEPNEDAHRKDNELIKAVLSLDVTKFYAVLERQDVSACGYGAIASTMVVAKQLGATKGELLRYATSGDVTGDTSAVVGYSSIAFV